MPENRTSSVWARYDRWTEAIADVVFDSDSFAGRPVYLDLEPEVLGRLAARLSIPAGQDVKQALAQDVRAMCDIGSQHAFERHLRRHQAWRRGNLRITPPSLPLLAVFSLAAEQMGAEDGISSANYYVRLVQLLGGDAQTLASSYRHVAERLWGGLNLWLERNDGERGLPTALALGHRHVGLAVSQALIREADRLRLHLFFEHFDLPPRSVVPPQELEPLLDSWIRTVGPSPAGASLVRLWAVALNRSVICEVAATELAEWTGAVSERAPRQGTQRARLVLSRRGFPRPQILLSAVLPARVGATSAVLLSGASSEPEEVPLEFFREGLAMLGEQDTFSNSDLLSGVLTLRIDGVGEVRRVPQGVVVLKHDDLSNTWIESVRVLLGDSLMLLVHRDRLERVEKTLSEIARPGWTTRTEIAGLPEEWVEIDAVEIFGRPITRIPESSDLAALIPATARQLQLAGGMKIPGRVRNRWHVGRPPELRAVSDGDDAFTITLIDLGPDASETSSEVVLESWTSDASNSVVVDLATSELAVGQYALVMQEQGAKAASQRLSFSLRSSATPDEQSWASAPAVVHDWTKRLAVVGADDGAPEPTRPSHAGVSVPLETLPWWRRTLRDERAASIGLARPPQASCFYTGQHRMKLDTTPLDAKGRPLTETTLGRCTECGTERSYSNDPRKAERAKQKADRDAAEAASRARAAERPPVQRSDDEQALWFIALDLLVYFGGGDFELLRRVASEVTDGAQFASHFARVLEGLGHISVRRSSITLAPEAWHVDPKRAARVGDVTSLLGAWPASEIDALRRAGATASEDHLGEMPGIRRYIEVDDAVLAATGVETVQSGGARMLEEAPSLSELLPVLPRVGLPSTLRLERFDPPSASWIPTVDVTTVGAYRTVERRRHHYVRTAEDLANGTAALVDTYTAKHLAAVLLTRKAMAAYHEQTRELICPIGADLPVLYDRAVVSDTQRPPFVRRGFLIYPDVSPELAGLIGYLLTH